MYIGPLEQNMNLAKVEIINDADDLMKQEKKTQQKLAVEEAVATLGPIPDEIRFTHNFSFKDKCLEKQEESIFFIESVGELKLGGHIKRECLGSKCQKGGSTNIICGGICFCCKILPCCCCFTCCDKCGKCSNYCQCCKCCNNCQCCNCCLSSQYEALHSYQFPLYILKNEKVRFEYFSTYAKLYVQDTLVLEFLLGSQNFSDRFCGSCKSNIPHIYFTNPLNDKNEKIYFEPLGNKCPTNPRTCFCLCAICSFVGICESERTIVANVGENGSAKIIARRPNKNAWLSQCGCQDRCYHFIDYPDFEMKFTNLSNIQKLGLIMSTISYTIFGRWSKFYNYRGMFFFNTSFLDYQI